MPLEYLRDFRRLAFQVELQFTRFFEFLRANGIKFVTIPPHTSHRLRPLKVAFFKSSKTNYAENVRIWLKQNPGQVVTPSRVAGIFSKAFLRLCRMELAVSGFAAKGIFFLQRNLLLLKRTLQLHLSIQIIP